MVLQKIGSQAKYLDTAPSSGSEGELWKNFLYATLVLQSISETTSSNTRSFDVNGVADPENATMQLTGVDNVSAETRSGSLAPGGSDSITVSGDDKPTNASLTISGSYSETTGSEYGTATPGESVSIFPSGSLGVENGQISLSGVSQPSDYENRDMDVYLSEDQEYGDYTTATVTVDTYDVDEITEIDFIDIYGQSDISVSVDVDGTSFDTVTVPQGDSDGNLHTVTATGSASVGSTTNIKLTIEGGAEAGYSVGDAVYWKYAESGGTPVQDSAIEIRGVDPTPVSVSLGDGSGSFSTSSDTTRSLPIDSSTSSVDIDPSAGSVSYDISWTEKDGVEDPSVSVGSSTVSHNGVLDGSTTETVDLSTGSETIDASYSGSGLSYALTYNTHEYPTDSTIQLDGGSTTLTHTGTLEAGQTAEKTVDLSRSGHSASVSSDGPVEAEVVWTDVSETKDPALKINGHATSHTGTLTEGETTSLQTDPDWIQEGTNTVTVELADPGGGPTPQVGVEYQHTADSASKTADVNATAWGEAYNVSNTFASEQQSATATLPFSGNVVGLNTLEIRENNGEWYTPVEDDITFVDDGPRVELALGDVAADTTVDIRADARKVSVPSGAVDVTNPTVGGNTLQTTFEVTDAAGTEPVVIDISNTSVANPDHVRYLQSSSWADAATMETNGATQRLVLPEANTGGTATVETLPVEVQPARGVAEIDIQEVTLDDESEAQLQFELVGSTRTAEHEVIWHDTTEGQEYVLYSQTTDVELDTATPASPATLVTDGSEQTYTILERPEQAALVGGGGGREGGGFWASIPLVGATLGPLLGGGSTSALVIFLVGLAGIALIARSIGGPTPSPSSSGGRTTTTTGRGGLLPSLSWPSLPSLPSLPRPSLGWLSPRRLLPGGSGRSRSSRRGPGSGSWLSLPSLPSLPRPSLPSLPRPSLSWVPGLGTGRSQSRSRSGSQSTPTGSGSGSGSMLSRGLGRGRSLLVRLAVFAVGVGGLTLVLLELSTPRSIAGTAIHSLSTAGVVPIVAAVAILLTLWMIDTWTQASIPLWMQASVSVILSVWVLETLAPGTLEETIFTALASGLEDVSAIIWIAVVIGGGYLVYRWLNNRGGSGGQETHITLIQDGENR